MDEQEATTKKAQKQQPGFWGSMGGVQKVILLVFAVGLFFLIWTFIFGGISNVYQLIMFGISFIGLAILFYIILTAITWYLAPEYFSPKKDYFTRIVNLGIDLKPKNVKDLYFMGDKDKQRVKAGKIIGLLGIPYLIGKPKFHEKDIKNSDGETTNKKGEPVFEYSNVLKKKIPVYSSIEYAKDGDTLFIYESGWFLFKKRNYLRCHRSLHGDLNGDVVVHDINPVPYGSLYTYPFKQLQRSPAQIMMQNQLEVILATNEHFLDLVSQGVDQAIYFNPTFRAMQKQQAELSE